LRAEVRSLDRVIWRNQVTTMYSNHSLTLLLGSLVVLGLPVSAQAQTPASAPPSAPVITSDAPVPAANPSREVPANQPQNPPQRL
jgi:hypothetical protein